MRTKTLILLKLLLVIQLSYSQSITRDVNNRITQVKYEDYTILYTYGSNGERLSRQIMTNSTNPLPVDLLSFTANEIVGQKQSKLQWVTASEQNSSHFLVEHSLDITNFQTLKSVKAAGNSKTKKTYTYIHRNPVSGTNYYRLKQIDQDGSSSYSPIRSVIFDFASNLVITLFPNPANQQVSIQVEGEKIVGNIDITLQSNQARKMLTRSFEAQPPYLYQLNVGHLASGTYYVTIQVNGKLYKAKLSVIH